MSRRAVQLSRDFWLHEIPHWDRYSDAEVAAVRKTAGTILQPLRRRFGPIDISSGLYWSWGAPRDGAHAYPGTLDFYPRDVPLRLEFNEETGEWETDEVYSWAAEHLAGNIGQLIHERDHLHVTLPGTPIRGRPRYGEFWLEPEEGTYVLGSALPLAPAVALALLVLVSLALAVIR